MKKPTARELAILCMMEVEEKNLLVSQSFTALGITLKPEDMALAHELTYGTFRFVDDIDEILERFCKKPLAKMPTLIQWVLRCGVYQLLHMRTPAYAAINESVNLAGLKGFKGLKPVVNAILRNIQRKIDKSELKQVSIPDWFEEVLLENYGKEKVDSWLSSWKQKPIISYWSLEETEDKGLEVEGQPVPVGHARFGNPDLSKMNYVQNESAQAIAEIACRSGSDKVLDYCAAPGGKTAYIKAFGKTERLLSTDISEVRLQVMQNNLDRLKLTGEMAVLQEAKELKEAFDFVLVDAPCSALGILARHPEISFLRKTGADKDIYQVQQDILNKAWAHVAPGGCLFYAICTLDPRELPELPEGAVLAGEKLKSWAPEGVPFEFPIDGYFYIQPGNRFDGFSGFLISKES